MTIHHSGPQERQGKSDRLREDYPTGEHMAILNQRAYSRHRGVALSAVQKAIETGRIK
jgi:hypothetical protein